MPKYKSGLEANVARSLARRGVKFKYESKKLPFVQPAKKRTYKPDFELPETGVFVECKGRLTQADRNKLEWIKETYPSLRLVILFQRADNPIRRGSKTRYRDWADKVGFEWADWSAGIPDSWTKNNN